MSKYAYIRESDHKVFHVELEGHTVTYLRSADGTEEDTLCKHSNEKNDSYKKVEMICPAGEKGWGGVCEGPLAVEGGFCCEGCSDHYYAMVKKGEIDDFIP